MHRSARAVWGLHTLYELSGGSSPICRESPEWIEEGGEGALHWRSRGLGIVPCLNFSGSYGAVNRL